MRQVEVSRTVVFDQPRHTRAFFEALLVDNLDVGRPEHMQVVFGRRVRTDPPGGYRTRLVRNGDHVTLDAHFRHSRVKSYLKEGRAFRIETVVNDPGDLGLPVGWNTSTNSAPGAVTSTGGWSILSGSVRVVSSRAQPSIGPRDRPSRTVAGLPALWFGDPRVMALAGALCAAVHA
jgi:hypothetical protein